LQERHAAGEPGSSVLQTQKGESINIDSSEIDTYLQALDEELANRAIRKPVRLAVVGGVLCYNRYANRQWQQECMLEATLEALFESML
jgi:menaquinone-dependent protoporphyrinogen IX oxidase